MPLPPAAPPDLPATKNDKAGKGNLASFNHNGFHLLNHTSSQNQFMEKANAFPKPSVKFILELWIIHTTLLDPRRLLTYTQEFLFGDPF